jgi:hypothetical protein
MGQSHRRRPKWIPGLVVLVLCALVLPAEAEDRFRPVRGQLKPYVADADLALIGDQSSEKSLKEMTLENVERVFSELPHFAFQQSADQLPEPREDDPPYPEALLRTKSDSLSGRISVSDIQTAVLEESIPGDSGEQFLEEIMELFKGKPQGRTRKLLSQKLEGALLKGEDSHLKGKGLESRSGGLRRRLLADSVETPGNGVTLTEGSSTSDSDSGNGNWGPLSKGAWIGIIIAFVFLVGAVTILCWCLECVCCCCCF